ncbi:DUF4810 domain-containing protein [Cupriavidus respiraculi]|uniref:Lipoprotein n=1 Tax=Cupriavidus respiraculi TaxID=195930 RepID=A0ABM8XN19_9BURK|nr:DUF4810 domain-containing protein [Cupriavidus respiraculi]CAG9181637.1 hypothetical protein LMG21510_04358 [Cupriavidus respiraculi]
MNKSLHTSRSAWLAAVGTALLVGCANQATLYQWEGYQPQVYQYFKGEPKEAQIQVLEADLEKIKASGKLPPPGYHAHLGLLYADLGKDDEMVREFQTEKRLFPESGTYVDFLLRNVKRTDKKAQADDKKVELKR